ncbi:hypothetical protein L0244_21570 [bacterium]|nr:hypothetical protein [bacterium]
MNLGSRFDVNNSIVYSSAYPGGRASGYAPPSANRYRARNNFAGELGGVNADAAAQMAMQPEMTSSAIAPGTPGNRMAMNGNGIFGQPARWWIGFVIVFALFVWASRRFNGGEKFTNIRMSVYNGIFLTIFVVLILNLLKVFAARFPVPGLSALILAA